MSAKQEASLGDVDYETLARLAHEWDKIYTQSVWSKNPAQFRLARNPFRSRLGLTPHSVLLNVNGPLEERR